MNFVFSFICRQFPEAFFFFQVYGVPSSYSERNIDLPLNRTLNPNLCLIGTFQNYYGNEQVIYAYLELSGTIMEMNK